MTIRRHIKRARSSPKANDTQELRLTPTGRRICVKEDAHPRPYPSRGMEFAGCLSMNDLSLAGAPYRPTGRTNAPHNPVSQNPRTKPHNKPIVQYGNPPGTHVNAGMAGRTAPESLRTAQP